MLERSLVGLTLNYRDAERTSRCIESLLEDGAAGVLVWDNSSDGGASAQALYKRWQDDPRVVVEISTNNLGFAAGVNRGLEVIKQRWPRAWVMLLNNDALVPRGALARLHAVLHATPQAVLAYPCIEHGGRLFGTIYYQRHLALLRFGRSWPASFPYPCGAALLIALDRYHEPLFDEDFFMYGEDIEIGWRLGPSRMVHVSDIRVWHEGSATARNRSLFYETHINAGHWLLAQKIARSRSERFVLMAGRLISLTARALWRSVRSLDGIPLRGALRGWDEAKRRGLRCWC